ncbi:hypothetical protein [Streptomyces sp. 039-1]|uniref:hypothetical protein n=1 Tax=Streptomyces sp. 039-1 TaxID=2789263 RepID=UPI0039F45242
MAGNSYVDLEAIGVTTTVAPEGVGKWSSGNVVPVPTSDKICHMERFADEFTEVDEDSATE